jgi:hypothetical protein
MAVESEIPEKTSIIAERETPTAEGIPLRHGRQGARREQVEITDARARRLCALIQIDNLFAQLWVSIQE